MDPRRRLILRPAACAALALSSLPAACARPAPPPSSAPVVSIAPIELLGAPVTDVHPVDVPRLVWADCRSRVRRSHVAHDGDRRRPRSCRRAFTLVATAAPSPRPSTIFVPAGRVVATPPVLKTGALAPAPQPRPAAFARAMPTAPAAPPPLQDHREGAVRVFVYAPGRVYDVAAAPLRVTTLALQAGETLIDKAAGDTVRWQIGETTSGSGASTRTLVLIKPLTAGLSTNMVLTTSQRVYLIDLTSLLRRGDPAIVWAYAPPPSPAVRKPVSLPAPVAPAPSDQLDLAHVSSRYRIAPEGRRPSWTPQTVFDDGRRTFIAFGPDLDRGPAPLLFVRGSDGRVALVNYRQHGSLFIVDRLFDQAELRLGDRHPQVVHLAKLEEGQP